MTKALHKKLIFPLRISSINLTKPTGNCAIQQHTITTKAFLKTINLIGKENMENR